MHSDAPVAAIELTGAWELRQDFAALAPGGFAGAVVQGLFVCTEGRLTGSNAAGWIWYGALGWDADGVIACEVIADPLYAPRDAALPGPDGLPGRKLQRFLHRLPVTVWSEPLVAQAATQLGAFAVTTTLRRLARFVPLRPVTAAIR